MTVFEADWGWPKASTCFGQTRGFLHTHEMTEKSRLSSIVKILHLGAFVEDDRLLFLMYFFIFFEITSLNSCKIGCPNKAHRVTFCQTSEGTL